MDQELSAVVRDAQLGTRLVDKLVKVTGNDGQHNWLYIHIEIQSQQHTEFAKRMFVYNYRLFDRYDTPITSLAILGDDSPEWKPNSYSSEVLGCRHYFEFPIAKVHLLTQSTKDNPVERFAVKRKLVRILYEKEWEQQRFIDVFRPLDWMMHLPEPLSKDFREDLRTIEEAKKMKFVSTYELMSHQEGMLAGLQQGRQEGEIVMLRLMLTQRFGELPVDKDIQLKSASEDQLKLWSAQLFKALSLDDVFRSTLH